MNELFSTFQSLDALHQIFWACAVIGSLLFVIQFIFTIIGLDHDTADMDFHDGDTTGIGGGMNLFTIKNLIGFVMGFGWAGVCLNDSIKSVPLLIILALLVGCIFVATFVIIYKQTRKLDHNGAFDIKDCIGKTASVYLRIPAGGEGKGKIQISINGSVHELNALSDEDAIASGQTVKVVEVLDGETVKVVNEQHNLVI